MRTLYNTNDAIFTDEDVRNAFIHAYFVGKGEWQGDPNTAYIEWREEYERNNIKELTLEAITDAVLEIMGHTYFDVIVDDTRYRKVPLSRQLICWFAYIYTSNTLHQIRRHMKYDNHVTVMHGRDIISSDIQVGNKNIIEKVNEVKHHLHRNGYALKPANRKIEMEVKYV